MTSSNLESRAARVGLVTGASVGVTMVFQLISVPICLHFWGRQLYGEWLAIFAAANLLRVVDNGYVTYAGNRLNILYHDNRPMLHRVLASGVLATGLLGILQVLALLVIIRAGWLGWILGNTSVGQTGQMQTALIVLTAGWIIAGAFFALVHRLMIPTGMLYQSAWWSMATQAAIFISVIIAAMTRLDLVGTSLLVASVRVVIYVVMALYVWRKLPEFKPHWRSASLKLAIFDLFGSMVFSVNNISQQLSTNGLVLVVSSSLGATAVPVFTTTRTLVNLWNSVISTLTNPLLPDIVRLHVQRQTDKLLLLARAHEWLVGAAVTTGVIVTYPLTVWAYGIWTHHTLVLDVGLLATLLASMLFVGAGSFMTCYLVGINDKHAIMATASCRAIMSFVISVILVRHVGLVGIGLGVLASEATCYALMVLHYFPRAIRTRGDRPVAVRTPAWLAGGIAIASIYLGIAAYFGNVFPGYYGVSSGLLLACAWIGWRQLDGGTRIRLLALVTRFRPLVPRP